MIGNVKIRARFRGFTLIEILIVMAIFSVLAAVALPTVRKLVSDQKGANTARSISAFIDLARRRAVAEGRPMGILIERLDATGQAFPLNVGQSASIRIRQTLGVPAYSGEAADAVATLQSDDAWPAVGSAMRPNTGDEDPIKGVDTAVFDASDNQLLLLAAQLYENGEQASSPIKVGDPIEFPGGRIASIQSITRDTTSGPVRIHFDLTENRDFDSSRTYATQSFPNAERTFGSGQSVKYKVHRRPSRSSTAPLELPRGMAIDMNYSGMGAFGNEFAASTMSGSNIQIIFGADGRVTTVNNSSGGFVAPVGLIFLCLGTTDGLRPDSLLSKDDKAPANLNDLDSVWVVINPNTGRVVSSPNASVSTTSSAAITTPSDGLVGTAINEARTFAFLSDTIDNK